MSTDLYVAFDQQTSLTKTFRAPSDSGLAVDVTQVDADGVRRAYRRCDRYWLAYIQRHGADCAVADLRAEVAAVHGLAVLDELRLPIPPGYRLPEIWKP